MWLLKGSLLFSQKTHTHDKLKPKEIKSSSGTIINQIGKIHFGGLRKRNVYFRNLQTKT